MARSFSVLYVSSELYPYAKVSSLADVTYSLPMAMRELGHDIRVMLPKYGNVSERKNKIHEINRLKDLPIPIGDKSDLATVKSSSISSPRVKVQAYITTNVNYLDMNKGIYRDVKSGKLFPDNDERFIFFNKTVIETCLILGWVPDIIHVNDWQTALVPAFAKVFFPNKFKRTKTVLTIHDMGDQGEFPASTFEKTGLPPDLKDKFIQNGKFNFIKGALNFVDAVNTVSPTYAQEIYQDTNYTNGLNSLLLEKEDKFSGILNGIDTWIWDPKDDDQIFSPFEASFTEFKKKNREGLLSAFCLPDNPNVPIVNVISPLYAHNGSEILIQNLEQLLEKDLILIFMCDGEPDMKSSIKKLVKKYPKKFAANFSTEETLSHKVVAGSDITLLPSIYEPGGINAMLNLSYGTIPVARQTGAFNDFLSEYNSDDKSGNAFLYSDPSPESMFAALDRAMSIFRNKGEWEQLAQSVMTKDYSWNESAKKYDEIYRNLMKD